MPPMKRRERLAENRTPDAMHNKRGKPKKARASYLLYKPHKMNGGNKLADLSKTGFGKTRRERAAQKIRMPCGNFSPFAYCN